MSKTNNRIIISFNLETRPKLRQSSCEIKVGYAHSSRMRENTTFECHTRVKVKTRHYKKKKPSKKPLGNSSWSKTTEIDKTTNTEKH